MKIVSMVDASARETRAENLEDLKTAIGVVDEEIERLQGYMDDLRRRIEALEANRPTFSG
jgi:predicted  nucleic acid-binding Zn-ribbon protein